MTFFFAFYYIFCYNTLVKIFKGASTLLERAEYPEQVGVDSAVVTDLIRFYEKLDFNIDSLMVVRHGKVACECHWAPNRVDTPHDMFSLSKSVTATAIGIAVDEGYVSLDTKIYEKYFPHKLEGLTGQQKEWAQKVTVHDVLSMRMGKVTSVFDDKAKTDWVDGILDKPIQFEPNTDWKYISENAYLLSWIIQRETGMTMTEYLTPRLYEPLGIKVPHWEQSHVGVDAGGWGLKLTVEDIAKISMLYLNKGVYDGKRIFSEDWFNKATYPYTKKTYPVFSDNAEYGYQVWIDHEHNDTTYRFTGLYGQFSFIFPDYDACVVITASDTRDGDTIASAYKHFPKAFIEPCEISDEKRFEFKALTTTRGYGPDFKKSTGKRNPKAEKKISNRMIKLVPLPYSSTQGAVTYFMWRKKIGGLTDIKFSFDKDSAYMSFKENNSERMTIRAGMNNEYVHNVITLGENELIVDAQATWNRDGSLEFFLYNSGRPQSKRLRFIFKGNAVILKQSSFPGFGAVAKFNIEFNMGMNVGPKLEGFLEKGGAVFGTFYSDTDTVGRFVE